MAARGEHRRRPLRLRRRRSSRARESSGQGRPQHEQRDDDQRAHDERDVAAALDLLTERVESHTTTVPTGWPEAGKGNFMESLLVKRADGVVTCTLNRPAKK